jgi:hypothetical protein
MNGDIHTDERLDQFKHNATTPYGPAPMVCCEGSAGDRPRRDGAVLRENDSPPMKP